MPFVCVEVLFIVEGYRMNYTAKFPILNFGECKQRMGMSDCQFKYRKKKYDSKKQGWIMLEQKTR